MAGVKDNITGHRSDWSLLGTWEAIAKAKVQNNCCTQNQPVMLRNYQHLPKKAQTPTNPLTQAVTHSLGWS